jgi:poly(3-hydroxybutyrate) depolymerase
MKNLHHILFALLACLPATAAQAYPAGKSTFMFNDDKNRSIEVLVYQPKNFTSQSPIQFVMHGVSRNADATREKWLEVADRTGILIVAPKFSKHLFKHGTDYTLGEKNPKLVSQMTIGVVEKLFDQVKADTGSERSTYRIYGHSAGAQYVHRLMLMMPDNRTEWAIAANAGWYTLPEWRAESALPGMPYSMKDFPGADARLREALPRRLILMLGDKDTDPNHMQIEHGVEVDQQGVERYSRGKRFFTSAESAAKALGVKFGWEMKLVPGVAHDAAGMAAAAIKLMYEKLP